VVLASRVIYDKLALLPFTRSVCLSVRPPQHALRTWASGERRTAPGEGQPYTATTRPAASHASLQWLLCCNNARGAAAIRRFIAGGVEMKIERAPTD